uniref:Uncharacterized protein n=1 Tax=viral metagenome TaxID=1070528 RepID=A0A6M3XN48_9ZZZZ
MKLLFNFLYIWCGTILMLLLLFLISYCCGWVFYEVSNMNSFWEGLGLIDKIGEGMLIIVFTLPLLFASAMVIFILIILPVKLIKYK